MTRDRSHHAARRSAVKRPQSGRGEIGRSAPLLLCPSPPPDRLQPAASCLLPTVHCRCLLPTAYRLPPTAYCLPPTAFCLLPTAYRLLPTAYRLLPTAYRLSPTAYCLLLLLPTPYSLFFISAPSVATPSTTISTRRFWARPSSVSLPAVGWYSANPAAESRLAGKP